MARPVLKNLGELVFFNRLWIIWFDGIKTEWPENPTQIQDSTKTVKVKYVDGARLEPLPYPDDYPFSPSTSGDYEMAGLIAFIQALIAEIEALFNPPVAGGKPKAKVACCDCSSIIGYSIPVETLQRAAEAGASIQDVLALAVKVQGNCCAKKT